MVSRGSVPCSGVSVAQRSEEPGGIGCRDTARQRVAEHPGAAGIAGGASRFRAAATEAERRRNSVGGPAESGAGGQHGGSAPRGPPTNRGGGRRKSPAQRSSPTQPHAS